MSNSASIWHIPEIAASGETFRTLIGKYPSGHSTLSDSQLSAHFYLLKEGVEDQQSPHCGAEFYYVLEGSRTLESGHGDASSCTEVKTGDLIFVPRELPHRFTGNAMISLLVVFGPEFTGPPADGICQPQIKPGKMKAGFVSYQRQGDQFVGKWSHENLGGKLADETVSGVAPGAVEGTWDVVIYNAPDPAGNRSLMFEGTLSSEKCGESLKWRGRGRTLRERRRPSSASARSSRPTSWPEPSSRRVWKWPTISDPNLHPTNYQPNNPHHHTLC